MAQNKPTVKEYTKGDLTVVWQPAKCIHSEKCFHGLPEVFDPQKRPWINVEGASSQQIREQVERCPSGALSYYVNEKSELDNDAANTEIKVEVMKNGPLMVYGDIEVQLPSGESSQQKRATAFCRCGGSGNKPYCDGTHKKIDFEG